MKWTSEKKKYAYILGVIIFGLLLASLILIVSTKAEATGISEGPAIIEKASPSAEVTIEPVIEVTYDKDVDYMVLLWEAVAIRDLDTFNNINSMRDAKIKAMGLDYPSADYLEMLCIIEEYENTDYLAMIDAALTAGDYTGARTLNELRNTKIDLFNLNTEKMFIPEAPRYGFTMEDIYLLAQLTCGSGKSDGDGEYDIDFQKEINYFELSKVLDVVMNRVRSGTFPNNVHDVVMQQGQFSVMPANAHKTPSDKALQAVGNWCRAYDLYDPGVQVVPEDHLYFHSGPNLTNVTRTNY